MNLTEKISWDNVHIYFFYLFLLSIPFQTRKVFLTEYSFYSGAFTEYATFFVYASDILLILTLIFWFVFNKKLYKCLNTENLKNARELSVIWSLLFIFIIWLIISAIVNNNYTEISVFYILKFIEFSLLIIYIYFNLRNKHKLITALFVISLSGFFQGLIAIYQFMYQSPLFRHPLLQKLTGESTVYPQVSGVAKIIVDNEKLIRAYGTFPHPNLLGGFLIISILISIYLLLKHKSYILSRLNFKYNITNTNKSQVKAYSLLLSLFWILFIFTQITALLFTFSRTAWIGFLISLFLIGICHVYRFSIVSRETIEKNLDYNLSLRGSRNDRSNPVTIHKEFNHGIAASLCGAPRNDNKILSFIIQSIINTKKTITESITKPKELFVVIFLSLILITVYSSHISSRMSGDLLVDNYSSSNYLPSNYAFNDRIFYNNVSRETISGNFIFGSGPGTFIFQIDSYLTKNNIDQKFESWQYQPAHNIYLLIASEIGIIGLFLFLFFVFSVISNNLKNIKTALNNNLSDLNDSNNKIVSRETIYNIELNYFLIAILTSFLFVGFFDHYSWTLQQGRLIFWLALGLMLISSRTDKK